MSLLKSKNIDIDNRINKSNEFEIIRIILASAVVFQHSTAILDSPNILNFNLIPAVPIFVFISGLLVSESLLYSSSLKNYLQKRIRRILPAYIFIVIFSGTSIYILNTFLKVQNGQSIFSLLKYFFFNIIFLNFKFPCLFSFDSSIDPSSCAVNGSLWTIKFELLFYLLLPLIFFCGRNTKLFFPLLTIINLCLLIFYKSMPIYLIIFLCFLIGVGCSRTKKIWMKLYRNFKMNSFLRFFIVISIVIFSGGVLPLYLVLPLLLMTSLFPSKNKNQDIKILKKGDLSYGIYLIHYPLMRIFETIEISTKINQLLLPFVVLSFSIIFAYFLHNKFETKFLNPSSHYMRLVN